MIVTVIAINRSLLAGSEVRFRGKPKLFARFGTYQFRPDAVLAVIVKLRLGPNYMRAYVVIRPDRH